MDDLRQSPMDEKVARRIESERDYHKIHYSRANSPLQASFDLATAERRKPHNLAWVYYDTILDHFNRRICDKRILVIGCGEGETALNFAKSGACVDAFDLSEDAIAICKRRAEFNGIEGINFFVSSCEELQLPSHRYDAVVGEMILHHIDIPIACRRFKHLLKNGGIGVFMEWKIYPILDRLRSTALLRRIFPPGGVGGYATEFERKLSIDDLMIIEHEFPSMRLIYRYCMRGKVDYFSPNLGNKVEKLDYWLLRSFPFLNYFTDGVVIKFVKTGGDSGALMQYSAQ